MSNENILRNLAANNYSLTLVKKESVLKISKPFFFSSRDLVLLLDNVDEEEIFEDVRALSLL